MKNDRQYYHPIRLPDEFPIRSRSPPASTLWTGRRMIPSLIASEVEDALRDFLSTQFRPSNPDLSDIIENFLAERKNLLKGPYLSIDLPFQRVPGEGEPFPEIPLEFVPYRHQRTAFERLSQRRSTVVATGTGSGKTECFLYPILEWCRQQSGKPGIKAILIYPMNALAMDQAGRIAKLVHSTPSLRSKVNAGIYIGQGARFRHDRMTAKNIIANRKTLVGTASRHSPHQLQDAGLPS